MSPLTPFAPLTLAIPSKGRLEEDATALFATAGIPLIREGRGYQGQIATTNIRVLYLSAAEIAARLVAGEVHLGITGEDLLREEVPAMDAAITLLKPLGFGKADVVLAVPDAWIDVTRMSDLAEVATHFRARHHRPLRIATKYTYLASNFLAYHGVYDCTLVKSFGATEGAPASGAAEAIVDITSTGATLTANNLRILRDGLILKSQANLVASLTMAWDSATISAAKTLFARLEAHERATENCQIQMTGTIAAPLIKQFETQYAAQRVTADRFLLPRTKLDAALAFWDTHGVGDIMVHSSDFIYAKQSALYDRLATRLRELA